MYLFGPKNFPCSVVPDDRYLTEEHKADGIFVEELPEKPPRKDGFDYVLYLDENRQPYYKEIDITNQIVEAEERGRKKGQDELMLELIKGGKL